MAATESFGLKLYLASSSGSPTVYTQVAGVTEIGGLFSFDRSQIDTSVISDTVKQFLAGQLDPGTLDFTVLFDAQEATHGNSSGLLYTMVTRGTFSWCLEIPPSVDGAITTYMYFQGVTISLNPTGAPDDAIRASCSIKMSGQPEFTTTAPATS